MISDTLGFEGDRETREPGDGKDLGTFLAELIDRVVGAIFSSAEVDRYWIGIREGIGIQSTNGESLQL